MYDEESGFLCLAHAICDLMFEIERIKNPDVEPKEKILHCIECKKNFVCEKSSSLCWACFTDAKIYKKYHTGETQ